MLMQLWLPILLSGVALFFASFLSWMILQLHKNDWRKLPCEDEFLSSVRGLNIPAGSYMFPGCNTQTEMQSAEFKQKFERGPVGIMTVFSKVNMGRNLGLTFAYFLAVSFCLAYLGTIGVDPGAGVHARVSLHGHRSFAGLLARDCAARDLVSLPSDRTCDRINCIRGDHRCNLWSLVAGRGLSLTPIQSSGSRLSRLKRASLQPVSPRVTGFISSGRTRYVPWDRTHQ